MAQEKYRKAVTGYWSEHGEGTVGLVYYPCSMQQPAGTSARAPMLVPSSTALPLKAKDTVAAGKRRLFSGGGPSAHTLKTK